MSCNAVLNASWLGLSVQAQVLRAAFVLIVVTAMVWDLRARRIPNGLSGLLLVGGTVFSVLLQPSLAGLRSSLLGVLVGLGIWIVFYAVGVMGAGDVKFFAAASAWLGPALSRRAALIAGVLGGALAAIVLARGSELTPTLRRLLLLPLTRSLPLVEVNNLTENEANRQLPYGVALGLGVILAIIFPAVVCQVAST